ncbi:cytoplasmic protein [Pseudomonas sp. T8]|uniref:cytoplasmic protein n=1 Tax=Pseudomonas sp. T8 TaxID=645292 RepID=UPI0021476886|nr:cytoplasmic protein [Pseudomonas sp. T8]UUT22917.1 cytoplasmic protein [Pseudomonas sp. T8]
MNKFRLIVRKSDKLLGHFESDTPWAADAVQDISRCLSEAGYTLELLIADGERRLLESGPKGIQVLYSETIFKSTALR